jgi:alanine racemase
MSRPALAEVDLSALRHNYGLACRLSAGGKALPIVKANAYGHGATAVAQALEPLTPAFGVACIEEALELRDSGISKPILLLEGAFSSDEIALAADQDFWLMVSSQHQAAAILDSAPARPIKVWLKIDTGMHRLGVDPQIAKALYQTLMQSPRVAEGIVIATHFACADELDNPFTAEQIRRFDEGTQGIDAPRSLANSAGLLGWPQARGEWNRPGFMLYGGSPFASSHPEGDRLLPVMTLKSAIISIGQVPVGESVGYSSIWTAQRPSLIATVAIGYGDGYPRNTPNGTPVLIKGKRAPLAGRVSMDMITVDVTDLPDAAIGDEVTLWGRGLPLNEVATHAGTIGYELITRMPLRTPRKYLDQ